MINPFLWAPLMLVASVLGIVKFVLLAVVLPQSEYGIYAVVLGMASFCGMAISLGINEQAIKAYPRWWIEDRRRYIKTDLMRSIRKILVRSTLFFVLGVVIYLFTQQSFGLGYGIGLYVFAVLSCVTAQLMSVFRAFDSPFELVKFYFIRSGGALLLAVTGGVVYGVAGALLAEIAASVLTVTWAFGRIRRELPAKLSPWTFRIRGTSTGCRTTNTGVQLYAANMMSSGMSLMDRAIVGAAVGPAAAGSYGVIMLYPQTFQLVINVVSQRLGPKIIKDIHKGVASPNDAPSLAIQISIVLLLSAVGCIVCAICLNLDVFHQVVEKYELTLGDVAAAALVAAGQVYVLIEFQLIGFNRERIVLLASVSGFATMLLSFVVSFLYLKEIVWFVVSLGVARWVQIAVLCWGVPRQSPAPPLARRL